MYQAHNPSLPPAEPKLGCPVTVQEASRKAEAAEVEGPALEAQAEQLTQKLKVEEQVGHALPLVDSSCGEVS